MSLDDRLEINHNSTLLREGLAGQRIDLMDRFLTENDFHGGEIGFKAKRVLDPRWSIDVVGKLAIGGVHSQADIEGGGVVTDPSGVVLTVGDMGTVARCGHDLGRLSRCGWG